MWRMDRGEIAINPDGGLKCLSHLIGATDVRMIVELIRQVLGMVKGYQIKNVKVDSAHNLGGPFNTIVATLVIAFGWKQVAMKSYHTRMTLILGRYSSRMTANLWGCRRLRNTALWGTPEYHR